MIPPKQSYVAYRIDLDDPRIEALCFADAGILKVVEIGAIRQNDVKAFVFVVRHVCGCRKETTR